MSIHPTNTAPEEESDDAAWQRQERALHGDPTDEVAASLLLRLASAVPALLALALMLAWLLGEIASDRTWWTQFLEWLPLVLVVPAAGVLVGGADLARRLIRKIRPSDPTLPRLGRLVAGCAIMWATLLVYFLHVDCGGLRMLGIGVSRPEGVTPTRVLFWNSGAEEHEGWAGSLMAVHPDLCVMTSISVSAQMVPLIESMSDDPSRHPVWTLEHDRFTVLSRSRILRYGFTTLGITKGSGLDPRDQGPVRYYDPGRAMYVVLDRSLIEDGGAEGEGAQPQGAASHDLVVWVVDFPSDLSLPRAMVTEQASQSIVNFRGPEMVMDDQGRWVEGAGEVVGFPPPDLIVGDFNIPRGSWSIRTITGMAGGPMENAWKQAGRGYTATYPRHRPLLFIDQIYLKAPLRAVDFGCFSTGSGTHRPVWADVVRGP